MLLFCNGSGIPNISFPCSISLPCSALSGVLMCLWSFPVKELQGDSSGVTVWKSLQREDVPSVRRRNNYIHWSHLQSSGGLSWESCCHHTISILPGRFHAISSQLLHFQNILAIALGLSCYNWDNLKAPLFPFLFLTVEQWNLYSCVKDPVY